MKKLNFTILFAAMLVSAASARGQAKIKRQVVASYGFAHTKVTTGSTSFCMASTLGQPPSAGTVSDGSGAILRQGFQQPNPDNCALAATFTATKTQHDCGISYVFEYTGNIAPGLTISWNFGPNAVPMLADGATPPLIEFTQPGQQPITITVSDGTCSKSGSQILIAEATDFLVQTEQTDPLCFGQKGAIDLTATGGTAPYAFEWSNGAKTEDLAGLNPGDYSYTATDAKGCLSYGELTIVGPSQPQTFEAKVADELCRDTRDGYIHFTLQNFADPVRFTWSDGKITDAERDSLTAGAYSVTIADANGCSFDTAFTIRTFCELAPEEFIPDVFTPDGNGTNDLWLIDMIERFPKHSVQLFNRWGNIIWEANGNFAGWDGRNSDGEEMPVGAYFYVIQLNNAPDNNVYKGSVTIIR